MPSHNYNCKNCGTPIQGASDLCVLCYGKLHKPCPKCMEKCGKFGKKFRVVKAPKLIEEEYRHPDTGRLLRHKVRVRMPVDCSYCNNERFILAR